VRFIKAWESGLSTPEGILPTVFSYVHQLSQASALYLF
jgi:hypothetical protein